MLFIYYNNNSMIFSFKKTIIFIFIIMNKSLGFVFNNIKIKNNFILNKNFPTLYYQGDNINNINNINKLSLEHIFPKCYIDKKHHNDLHNIYCANRLINNIRSNFKFIDNNDKRFLEKNEKWIKIHGLNYINKENRLFIPKNIDKGIISRSILYMCYEYDYKPNKIIDIDTLIDWCFEFKPSIYEKNHNMYVMNKQHKYNKFISYYDKKIKLDKLIDKII